MENLTFGALYLSIILTPIVIRVIMVGCDVDDKSDVLLSLTLIAIWAWGFANYLMQLI